MDNLNGSTKINSEGDTDFYKLAQLIGDNIQKIIQNVASINKIVVQLDKIQDAVQIKQKLREISNYTQQLTKDTSGQLKQLYETKRSSQAEQLQFKIHKERLTERYKSALSGFQIVQNKIYDKENELMKQTKSSERTKILSPSSNNKDDYSTFRGNSENIQTQLQIQYTVDSKIIQRQQDVLQIENNVKDIREMYQQFSEYVDAQREMVDHIEENVLDTDALVNQGNTYLDQVTRYRNTYRRKLCYLLVICAVVIIVIYFVFIK